MSSTMEPERSLTFRALGRDAVTGVVKNPHATLGRAATKAARYFEIAGTFECLNSENEVLSPETRLEDLPKDLTEITLASELTPAIENPG